MGSLSSRGTCQKCRLSDLQNQKLWKWGLPLCFNKPPPPGGSSTCSDIEDAGQYLNFTEQVSPQAVPISEETVLPKRKRAQECPPETPKYPSDASRARIRFTVPLRGLRTSATVWNLLFYRHLCPARINKCRAKKICKGQQSWGIREQERSQHRTWRVRGSVA